MLKRIEELEDRLRNKYKEIIIGEDVCFVLNDGEIIHLVGLVQFKAIVIEYADSFDEAKKNMYDDGDLFYMDDYPEPERMFEDMIKEIDG